VNAVCEQRRTPLHDAVLAFCQASGSARQELATKTISLLLRNGALTLLRDRDHCTPLDVARHYDSIKGRGRSGKGTNLGTGRAEAVEKLIQDELEAMRCQVSEEKRHCLHRSNRLAHVAFEEKEQQQAEEELEEGQRVLDFSGREGKGL
jgi:hypothetical protein